MVFGEKTGVATATSGARYFADVVTKDELEFLHSKSTEHAKEVGSGSITGDLVEFVKDGKPLVEFEKWQELYSEVEDKATVN